MMVKKCMYIHVLIIIIMNNVQCIEEHNHSDTVLAIHVSTKDVSNVPTT